MTTKKPVRHFKAHFGSYDHFKLGNVGVRNDSYKNRNRSYILLDVDCRKRGRNYNSRCPLRYPDIASKIRALRQAIRVSSIIYSPTRKGWHIIIETTRRLSAIETIALQACLGSDVKRELMNLQRYFGFKGKKIPHFWKDRWNLLFARKLT